MHQAIYEKLKSVARAVSCVTYGEIAPLAGLELENPADRNELARILGEISVHEHDQGRPMLSAVVVLAGRELPGHGFFKLARELNLFRSGDETEFHAAELRRVHDCWRQPGSLPSPAFWSVPPISACRIWPNNTTIICTASRRREGGRSTFCRCGILAGPHEYK